jgi:hypothetical protein
MMGTSIMDESFEAREIQVGYHPDGFRIDKSTAPMERYTSWRITAGGQWIDPKPVCFDSMPARGWLKVDKFDWPAT